MPSIAGTKHVFHKYCVGIVNTVAIITNHNNTPIQVLIILIDLFIKFI